MADSYFEFKDDSILRNTITFYAKDQEEMLRISGDGFYVRGVKLEQDEHEARIVYENFKLWLEERGK